MNADVEKAVEYSVAGYPFVRCKASVFDGKYFVEMDSWRPGVEFDPDGSGDGYETVADGLGTMLLTEVSRHKPGRYPERVFYVRRFVTPDGVTFGKPALRIATTQKFNRLCKGYAHEFDLRITAHFGGENGN